MGLAEAVEQLTSKRPRCEDGFTLIEILISILVLGIIIGPLVSAYVLGIGTVAESNATTTSSADDQSLSAFFTNDVASAYRVSTTNNCGPGAPNVTVVQMEFGKTGSGASPFYVAYIAAEDTTAETSQNISPIYTLTRYTCDDHGATINSTQMASQMASVPVLACTGLTVATCDGTSRAPTLVSLSMTEYGRRQSDATYSFTISGTRRVTA